MVPSPSPSPKTNPRQSPPQYPSPLKRKFTTRIQQTKGSTTGTTQTQTSGRSAASRPLLLSARVWKSKRQRKRNILSHGHSVRTVFHVLGVFWLILTI